MDGKKILLEKHVEEYIENIKQPIYKLYKSETKEYKHEPTVFGDDSKENIEKLKTAFKIKQKQMKEGKLVEIVIGNFIGWEILGDGHPSGLDCRKKDNSIIMELKNKYNTCNICNKNYKSQ